MEFDLVLRGGKVVDGTGAEPFEADVAVQDEKIVAVGRVDGHGREEIDARGMLVTPGFVDIHTHYDGQATWENRLSPSSGHGVTTVVMGNCGVGFAPCRAEDRERLVELMEGVEDIPEIVMTAGLPWDWETYPEYLNSVERRPHDINIASYLPHSALRVYVMGERAAAGEAATPEDITRMAQITKEAMDAGAVGFGSSRTIFHRSKSGSLVPTLDAGEQELRGIAMAMQSSGKGVLQFAADYKSGTDVDGEFNLMKRVAQASGRPLSLPMAQLHSNPEMWRDLLNRVDEANADGIEITGQVLPRGVGMVLGLELSAHPFCLCPTYVEMADLPLAERVAKMRDPAIRAKLLSEKPSDTSIPLFSMTRQFDGMFQLGDPPDYEQPLDKSIGAEAARRGISPEEYAYDLLLERDGHGTLYQPFANYAYGSLDTNFEMFRHKNVVLGLGDGGAHYGMICDASYTTFMLTHWTRDRSHGERISIPQAVKALARDTAVAVGLNDRGVVAPGYRADLNVIDYDRLVLHAPRIVRDLPADGRRLTQKADGFLATVVNGQVVYRDGVATGALPGRLIRGAQSAPA